MIKLLQLLCPERHCYNAILVDDERHKEGDAIAQLWQTFHAMGERQCGICGSMVFHVESGKCKWQNWEEAVRNVHACQIEQRAGRELLDVLGVTFHAKRAN